MFVISQLIGYFRSNIFNQIHFYKTHNHDKRLTNKMNLSLSQYQSQHLRTNKSIDLIVVLLQLYKRQNVHQYFVMSINNYERKNGFRKIGILSAHTFNPFVAFIFQLNDKFKFHRFQIADLEEEQSLVRSMCWTSSNFEWKYLLSIRAWYTLTLHNFVIEQLQFYFIIN